MRRRVVEVLGEEFQDSASVVHGVTWHYSHPLERGLDIELKDTVDTAGVTKALDERGVQQRDIKAELEEDGLALVIPELDAGAQGERASIRAEEIAKANGWKLATRTATWLGQERSRESTRRDPQDCKSPSSRKGHHQL